MKNLTLTVEDELLRWAKVWAAKHDSSVSRLVADMLRERMRAEGEAYAREMDAYLARDRSGHRLLKPRPRREDLHDRELLRG